MKNFINIFKKKKSEQNTEETISIDYDKLVLESIKENKEEQIIEINLSSQKITDEILPAYIKCAKEYADQKDKYLKRDIVINLSNNNFTDPKGKIASLLGQSNNNIIELNLHNNKIEEETIIKIAAALGEDTTLRTLNLSKVGCISELSMTALAAAFEKNILITHVNFSGNEISVLCNLAHILQTNKSIQHLDLCEISYAKNNYKQEHHKNQEEFAEVCKKLTEQATFNQQNHPNKLIKAIIHNKNLQTCLISEEFLEIVNGQLKNPFRERFPISIPENKIDLENDNFDDIDNILTLSLIDENKEKTNQTNNFTKKFKENNIIEIKRKSLPKLSDTFNINFISSMNNNDNKNIKEIKIIELDNEKNKKTTLSNSKN